jgi:uncharacterized protein YlaN (UPF0358 family)
MQAGFSSVPEDLAFIESLGTQIYGINPEIDASADLASVVDDLA